MVTLDRQHTLLEEDGADHSGIVARPQRRRGPQRGRRVARRRLVRLTGTKTGKHHFPWKFDEDDEIHLSKYGGTGDQGAVATRWFA